jgi:hypothetical protein
MSEERIEKRAAIVGTANTWKETPWHDTGLDIFGLNDGYALGWRKGWAGLPRANGWYDLHPFHQMSFRPKQQTHVSQADVPIGAYLRPEGHLDWLRTREFPVYVNEAPKGWPDHVKTFPRAELEAKHGTYFSSTPAWMLVHLLEQGYTTIEVYGIHLATEYEYISQRPNFEFWLRYAIDRGCKIVLPRSCPILKSKHVYAYEPKPDLPLQATNLRIQQIKQEGAHLQKQLQQIPRWKVGAKADLEARLAVVNIELTDAKQAHQRVQVALQ